MNSVESGIEVPGGSVSLWALAVGLAGKAMHHPHCVMDAASKGEKFSLSAHLICPSCRKRSRVVCWSWLQVSEFMALRGKIGIVAVLPRHSCMP
ncbi:MAG: hypothetical protein ACLQOQ_07875 [Beijerinckiaceae bacterium]